MKINLNDKFYRYIDIVGMFEYVVKGIRNYEGENLFELECQCCNHGQKCLLLCALDDNKRLQYVRCLNDEDNKQTHFHTHSGQFFQTKKAALLDKGKRMIEFSDKEIINTQEKLKRLTEDKKNHIKYIEDLIATL